MNKSKIELRNELVLFVFLKSFYKITPFKKVKNVRHRSE